MNVRPGYWGECVTYVTATPAETTARQSKDLATPTQALIWVRVILRMVVSALGPAEARRAYDWLDGGQWTALARLTGGEPITFAVTTSIRRIEWSVRPVSFLPLAGREVERLPSCAERFVCTCPSGSHS